MKSKSNGIFLVLLLVLFYNNSILCASVKPRSFFVTQNSINIYSNFCWEYSGNAMYLPISSNNVGWGSTLLVQFDISQYEQTIKATGTLDSYLSIRTYCNSSRCTCSKESLSLYVVLLCNDLCSNLSNSIKDPASITGMVCNTRYTSDNLETAPTSGKIPTTAIFQIDPVKKLLSKCNFKYFTLGIMNNGACAAWVNVDSWEFTQL